MDSVWMNILNVISQIAGICSSTSTFLCQITCDQNVSVKPDTAVLLNQKPQQKDLLLKTGTSILKSGNTYKCVCF